MKITCLAALALLSMAAPSTQDPYQNPLVVVDYPTEGASIGRTFIVKGTALNSDYVHIWAVTPTGGVFLGGALTDKLDPKRQLGGGSFELSVTNAPTGNYPIVVYAHESSSNTFPVWLNVNVSVHACNTYNVTWPFYSVVGWTNISYQVCG